MDVITLIIENISYFLFCAFVGFFILPDFCLRLFHELPMAKNRKDASLLSSVRKKLFAWRGLMALIYGISYLFDPNIFYQISYGPLALACWAMGVTVSAAKLSQIKKVRP